MEIYIDGIYRHYKGKFYKVLSIAQHSENLQWLVIYQAQYGERKIWARPLDMFCDEVGNVKRFEYIEGGELQTFCFDSPKIRMENILKQINDVTRGYVTGNIEELEAQDQEHHKYEVFLTAKGLEHYKYRMFFIDHGTVSYPATIVMNEELAVEYTGKRTTVFQIESMKKLEDMMEKLLNSETMLNLIQSLINEALRQESMNQ